jgi:hypothetical protein
MNWDFILDKSLVDKHRDNFDKGLVDLGVMLDGISSLCNNTKVRNIINFDNPEKAEVMRIFFAILCEARGCNMSIVELMDVMIIIMRGVNKGDNMEHHYVILNRLKSFDTSIFPSNYITDLYSEHENVLGTECVLACIKKFTSEMYDKSPPSSKQELLDMLLVHAHTINEKVKEGGFLKTVSDKQLAIKLACEISGSKLCDEVPWYGVEVAKDG